MSVSVQHLLSSFEQLPETEKREVVSEIIRRAVKLSFPPLTDEELVLNAEAVFLALDESEAASA